MLQFFILPRPLLSGYSPPVFILPLPNQCVLFQTHLVMAPRRTRQYLCYLKLVDTNEVCYFSFVLKLISPFLDLLKLPYSMVR